MVKNREINGTEEIALVTPTPELIPGTKALQFVTFWNFLSFTENAGEHRSKDIDHIYGVQNWWSEWSQTTIFPYLDLVIFSVVLAIIHG